MAGMNAGQFTQLRPAQAHPLVCVMSDVSMPEAVNTVGDLMSSSSESPTSPCIAYSLTKALFLPDV